MLKTRLQAGETLFGTWLRIPHSMVIEILAGSGFDFIHVDMEHGAIGTQELNQILLAAKAQQLPTMVRVPGQDGTQIGRTLDLGANGIVVPQINKVEEARNAVQAAKYYPLGSRGLGGACRADQFGAIALQDFIQQANKETMLLLQIESKQAVEHIENILEQTASSVDVFYIGPADLSQSLGIPGQLDHPLLIETIEQIVMLVRRYGKFAGIHAPNTDWAFTYKKMGIQYITCSFDIGFLSTASRQVSKQLKTCIE